MRKTLPMRKTLLLTLFALPLLLGPLAAQATPQAGETLGADDPSALRLGADADEAPVAMAKTHCKKCKCKKCTCKGYKCKKHKCKKCKCKKCDMGDKNKCKKCKCKKCNWKSDKYKCKKCKCGGC